MDDHDQIPADIYDLMREVYHHEGGAIWWKSRNRMLNGKRPCDDHEGARRIGHMLADGNFA